MLAYMLIGLLLTQAAPGADDALMVAPGQPLILDHSPVHDLDIRMAKWCEDSTGESVFEGYWMSNEAGAQKAAELKSLRLALEAEQKKNEEQAAPGKLGLFLGAATLLLGGVFLGSRLAR